MVNIAELRRLLKYDPETGVFTRLVERGGRAKSHAKIGDIAGYICVDDHREYWRIKIGRHSYRAQRLAYYWMTGSCPAKVDHKNNNQMDNSWNNLRPATNGQNIANSRLRSDNKTGFKGVSARNHLFRMQMGPGIKIGGFATAVDAGICYNYHAAHLYGEFSRLNQITEFPHD